MNHSKQFQECVFVLFQSDPNRTVSTTRWEIIEKALLRDIKSSRDLEQAILTYNHKYVKKWNFKSLHRLFEEVNISPSNNRLIYIHITNLICIFIVNSSKRAIADHSLVTHYRPLFVWLYSCLTLFQQRFRC